MNRRLTLLAAAVVLGFAIWAIFAHRSSEIATAPPLTGWMANFIPAPESRPAPQTPLVSKDGKSRRLAEFAGRLVVANFWATWCAPCVRELPSLQRLAAVRGGGDVAVLAVSQDLKGWPVIEPFLARLGLGKLTVLHDPKGTLGRALELRGLPMTVLIGRDGKVIGRLAGLAEWDSPEALALIDHYATKGGR